MFLNRLSINCDQFCMYGSNERAKKLIVSDADIFFNAVNFFTTKTLNKL